MPIESASYVSQLNASNPASGDAMGQGDDQIRLIKQTLVASFPAVSGAVTATHAELNHTDGVISNIQTQLDGKVPLSGGTMTGTLTMNQGGSWYVKAGSVGPNAVGVFTLNSSGVNAGGAGAYFISGAINYAFLSANTDPWSSGVFVYPNGNTVASGLIYGRGGGAGLGQITISTGDPSGGADGDWWIKVA